MAQLIDYIKEVCPHCGSGFEYVVKYVSEHDKDAGFIDEVNALNEDQQEDLINMLLSSDYDIFTQWYKDLLLRMAEKYDNFRAKDILEYYHKSFEKVGKE